MTAHAVLTAASWLTDDTLDVRVLAEPGWARVRLWPTDDPAGVVSSEWAPSNAADVVVARIGGITEPRRAFTYSADVATDPAIPEDWHSDVERRLPPRPAPGVPASFRFVFASCINNKFPVPLARLLAADPTPTFLAFLGDLSYWDTRTKADPASQTYENYVADFRRSLSHPDLAPLLAVSSLVAVQDDHDYGFLATKTGQPLPAAVEAFADVVPGGVAPAPAWRRWSIGDVDFFLTDNRRHQGGGSVLGPEQKAWLLDGLASSTARLKVVFTPRSFSWSWAGLRKELPTFVNSQVSGQVLLCGGDKHASALCRPHPRITDMLAGPMANADRHALSDLPVASGVVWRNSTPTSKADADCVGVVDVDGSSGTAILTWLSPFGPLYRSTITFD